MRWQTVLIALLITAAVIFAAVDFATSNGPSKSIEQGVVSTTTTSTTTTTIVTPTTVAHTAPTTTTTKPVVVVHKSTTPTTARHVTTTTTAPLTYCTYADLSITTVTNQSTYYPGTNVVMTTTLKDLKACDFVPIPVGEYNCATQLVVFNASHKQVYPAPGQNEPCEPPSAEILRPGDADDLKFTWYGAQGDGSPSYNAEGYWAWNSGTTSPDVYEAPSLPFTISATPSTTTTTPPTVTSPSTTTTTPPTVTGTNQTR